MILSNSPCSLSLSVLVWSIFSFIKTFVSADDCRVRLVYSREARSRSISRRLSSSELSYVLPELKISSRTLRLALMSSSLDRARAILCSTSIFCWRSMSMLTSLPCILLKSSCCLASESSSLLDFSRVTRRLSMTWRCSCSCLFILRLSSPPWVATE